jgi:hypothetical protein
LRWNDRKRCGGGGDTRIGSMGGSSLHTCMHISWYRIYSKSTVSSHIHLNGCTIIFYFSCHICSILNGISGVTIMAAPPLISSLWFAPDERTTSTAINLVCPLKSLGTISVADPTFLVGSGSGSLGPDPDPGPGLNKWLCINFFGVCKSHNLRNLCCLTFWSMKILFRAYFHIKKFGKKLAENLLGSGSGSSQKSSRSVTLVRSILPIYSPCFRVFLLKG